MYYFFIIIHHHKKKVQFTSNLKTPKRNFGDRVEILVTIQKNSI